MLIKEIKVKPLARPSEALPSPNEFSIIVNQSIPSSYTSDFGYCRLFSAVRHHLINTDQHCPTVNSIRFFFKTVAKQYDVI